MIRRVLSVPLKTPPGFRGSLVAAARLSAAAIFFAAAVLSAIVGGGRLITIAAALFGVVFAFGAVVSVVIQRSPSNKPLQRKPTRRGRTLLVASGLFVIGYLASGIGMALFLAGVGGLAWLVGQ